MIRLVTTRAKERGWRKVASVGESVDERKEPERGEVAGNDAGFFLFLRRHDAVAVINGTLRYIVILDAFP
jgi:hypothetical protein